MTAVHWLGAAAVWAAAGVWALLGAHATVTDAAEWAVRTTKVPCSVEARIAGYAVELAESGRRQDIDWGKEIGLPADPAAELQHRLTDMTNAVAAHCRPKRVSQRRSRHRH